MIDLDKLIADKLRPGGLLALDADDYFLSNPAIPFFRNETGSPVKDLRMVTIAGCGKDRTQIHILGKPHDGFNLNNVANVCLRGFSLVYDGYTEGGANGISMTNGAHNISIMDVRVRELLPKRVGDHYEGGKAFTVQPNKSESPNIRLVGCEAIDCPIAFGVDCLPGKVVSMVVMNSHVESCDVAISLSCAGGNYPAVMNAYFDNMDVVDTCRLMLNGRFSNTRLANIHCSEFQIDTTNQFWTLSPFRQRFGENRLVCRSASGVNVLYSSVYADREWLIEEPNSAYLSSLFLKYDL